MTSSTLQLATDNTRPATNWAELLPNMFHDNRFHKTSRRRWQTQINGTRAGVVVASRSVDYQNYALNRADLDRLLELKRDGSFHAAFVVFAAVTGNFGQAYVSHRDAEELSETLKSVPSRSGQYGEYWLLREDISPFDFEEIPFN
jgi:hypothetical protein